MELLYILYKKQQYRLVYPLGHRNNKLCAIMTEGVNQDELAIIRKNVKRLFSMSLESKLQWLKQNCPTIYRNGYREIHNSNYSIVNRYKIP